MDSIELDKWLSLIEEPSTIRSKSGWCQKRFPGSDKIHSKVHFRDDKMDGDYFGHYGDGETLMCHHRYSKGLRLGLQQEFYQDGTLKKEEHWDYVAGSIPLKTLPQGQVMHYHSNGQLAKAIVHDELGKKNGWSLYYDKSGKLTKSQLYCNGRRVKR